MSVISNSAQRLPRIEPEDSQLPSNLDAERAVLGAVILDNSRFPAFEVLRPEDFFLREHQILACTIQTLHRKAVPIDAITLVGELEGTGLSSEAGGAAYVSRLLDGVPRISNVEHYALMVREKAALRAFAYGAESLRLAALEPSAELSDLDLRVRALAASLARSPKFGLKSVGSHQLLEIEVAPREMVLAPILPSQGLGMLYSKRGLGKTYLGLGIALAVAAGDRFLHWMGPKARPVLFVDGELPLPTLKERVAAVSKGMAKRVVDGMLRFITPDLQDGPIPDLSTREGQTLVEAQLCEAQLVILDNLSALCRSGKENEGESWLPVQEWALGLRQRGVSVLFVHHAGKGGAQRGTSRREDLLDVVVSLRHPADYRASDGLRCEVHYEKCRAFYGDDARPFEVKMETCPAGEVIWTTRDLENAVEARAAAIFAEGCTVREAADELRISKSAAGRLRKKWESTAARG